MKNQTISNILITGLVLAFVAIISEYDFPVMAGNLYTVSGLCLVGGSIAAIIRLNAEK